MKLFNKNKAAMGLDLTANDLVLLAMLNYPKGAVGESAIHDFIYGLTDTDAYRYLRDKLGFVAIGNADSGGLVFSKVIHRAIYDNCKDMSRLNIANGPSKDTSTAALFSDDLRFDLYEIVNKREQPYRALIKDYAPRIFFMTNMGHSVAVLALQGKLTAEQMNVLKLIADYFDNNTYILSDKNAQPESPEEKST